MLLGSPNDNALCDQIIASAIEVHRHLGPGLLESIYEEAICIELSERRLGFQRQVGIPLYYKGQLISEHRPDLVVAQRIVVEIKSTERLLPIHTAQVLTYLRVTNLEVGLLLNFNQAWMKHGIRRVMCSQPGHDSSKSHAY